MTKVERDRAMQVSIMLKDMRTPLAVEAAKIIMQLLKETMK